MMFFPDTQTLVLNVKDFGFTDPTGVKDSGPAFTSAAASALVAGKARIYVPAGTYLVDPLTLATGVVWCGAGYGATTLKLANGSNADLFSANASLINLSAANGAGSTGGVAQFGIVDMTLDANQANQSGTSYPLRFYGYGFELRNVRIKNGLSGGVLMDWNGGVNAPAGANFYDNLEAVIQNVKVHDVTGIGWQMGGPHDSIFTDVEIFDTTSHNLHLAPNAQAMVWSNSHFYSSTHGNSALAVLNESSTCSFSNCTAEGSDTVEVAFLDNGNSWVGGRVFTASQPSSGFQIGQQAGNTPYPSQILQSAGLTTAKAVSGYRIVTEINLCEGTNGSIWLANDAGGLVVSDVFNSTGKYVTGTRSTSTTYFVNGRGLASDGTAAKSEAMLVGGNVGIQNGTFRSIMSSTPATLNSNGTITTFGVGMARVVPSGAVTGIILQGGSFDGQQIVVVNEGSNSLTFDVSGTSHVASGTSAAIAANTSRLFVYDTSTSLWY